MSEFERSRRSGARTLAVELRIADRAVEAGLRRLARIAEALGGAVAAWRRARRRRAELARLGDATLKDIGLSRNDLPLIGRTGLDPRPLHAYRRPARHLVAVSAVPTPANADDVVRPAAPVIPRQTGVSTPMNRRRAS